MIKHLKPSIRKRGRWVASFLLVCIGFFHVTVAFSACLPTPASPLLGQAVANDDQARATGRELGSELSSEPVTNRISDLLCKTHCDTENAQASYVSVSAPPYIGAGFLYVAPVPMRPIALHARPPGSDIFELTAPDPVYLLSARLRV